jgi:hypothetical protein
MAMTGVEMQEVDGGSLWGIVKAVVSTAEDILEGAATGFVEGFKAATKNI